MYIYQGFAALPMPKPLLLVRETALMSSYLNCSKELNLGRAGEHLVMFDLLTKGYKCFLTDQGVNYDIVLDLGSRLVRLQVKTTQKPAKMNTEYRNNVYLFCARRAGKKGKRNYEASEFDGFALVTLDTKSVYYYHFTEQVNRTLIFRDSRETYKIYAGKISPHIEGFTLERFLEEIGESPLKETPATFKDVEPSSAIFQLGLFQ